MPPTVTGLNPDGSYRVRTDDGRELPVAPGTLPDLDAQAARLGGQSASEPLAFLPAAAMEREAATAQPPPPPAARPATATDAPAWAPNESNPAFPMSEDAREPIMSSPPPEAPASAQPAQRGGINVADLQRGGGAPQQQPSGADFAIMQVPGRGGGGGPRVTMSEQRRLYNPLPEDVTRELDESAAGTREAYRQASEVEQQRAVQIAEAGQRQADELAARQQAEATAQQNWQRRMEESDRAVRRATKRYEILSEDPFAEKGAGARFVAGLASALTVLGSSISGMKFEDPTEKQIQRELQAARDAIAARQGQFAELREQMGSDMAALRAHEAGIRQRFADTVAQIGAETEDENIRAKLGVFEAEQRQAAAQARAAAAQEAAGVLDINTTRRAGGGGGAPNRQVAVIEMGNGSFAQVPIESVQDLQRLRELTGEENIQTAPHIPGLEVTDARAAVQLRPEDATWLRQRGGLYGAIRGKMQRLEEISAMGAAERRLSPSLRDEVEALRSGLQGDLTVAAEQGAITGNDAERTLSQIPDVDALISAPERARTLRSTFEGAASARLRTYGYGVEGQRQASGVGDPVE